MVHVCTHVCLQSVQAHYNKMVYYMRFAMAAYGWKLYAFKNGLRGIFSTLRRVW